MTARFSTGDTFYLWPLEYQVVRGRKGPEDLVLQMRVGGDWCNVTMDHSFLQADFFVENEDYLYKTGQGGGFFTDRLDMAVERGWVQAKNQLQREKHAKRLREAS